MTAPPLPPRASTSQGLTDTGCVERHVGANVGRVAFVTPTGSRISPVSVRATGTSLMPDTRPGSSLSQLAEMGLEVTLEVDDTLAISDHAWNVLIHRPVSVYSTSRAPS